MDMRGHNEGSLFRRRTGQWVALVTMRDGRRVSRWAKDRDAAKVELAELLRLRDAGAPETGRVRLGPYLERWVQRDHGWAAATRRKHESIVRTHLVPAIGFARLSELSVADAEAAIARRSHVAPRTQSHIRATLRRALADAVRDGLIGRNVGGLARPVRQPHRERTILDAIQARRLIESTRDTRYGPLWTILVTTGLRISEALGLMWSSVDFGGNDGGDRRHPGGDGRDGASGVRGPLPAASRPPELQGMGDRGSSDARHRAVRQPVRVGGVHGPAITVRHQLARENGEWVRRQPKTAKGRRTIPLTPLGVEALRAQKAMQREWIAGNYPAERRNVTNYLASTPTPIDGLVFTSPTGHPLHGSNTVKALAADLAAAGLPKVTQHDLRHTSATLLYSMGVPLETIADILGHSSSRITADLYRHRVAQLQQDAADKMQAVLG